MKTRSLAFVALLGSLGCGGRSAMTVDDSTRPTVAASCAGETPLCVRQVEDACAAPEKLDSICDAKTRTWHCPVGARPHARLASTATCLPFHDADVRTLGGSFVRVPTDDGRCLWIADAVETKAGATVHNVAFTPDLQAPFGTCPTGAAFAPESIVRVEGDDDPALVVQLTSSHRVRGSTRVAYRLFRREPGAPFGLRELGTGVGRWDPAMKRVVVSARPRFATDLDLADATYTDGKHEYLFGCPGPIDFLTERCIVARLDEHDAMELFIGRDHWVASERGRDGAEVFQSGPWVSAVIREPHRGGFLHLYAVGFGSDLQMHTASAPQGPWIHGGAIARCDLPSSDPKSFCAGPVVHEELLDPTRPDELVVTYGIGSTGPGGTGDEMWSRLVWIPRP